SPWGRGYPLWRRLTAGSARVHGVVPSSERFLPHSGLVHRRVRGLPTTHALPLLKQNGEESQPANARWSVGQDDIFSRCVSWPAISSSLSGRHLNRADGPEHGMPLRILPEGVHNPYIFP